MRKRHVDFVQVLIARRLVERARREGTKVHPNTIKVSRVRLRSIDG